MSNLKEPESPRKNLSPDVSIQSKLDRTLNIEKHMKRESIRIALHQANNNPMLKKILMLKQEKVLPLASVKIDKLKFTDSLNIKVGNDINVPAIKDSQKMNKKCLVQVESDRVTALVEMVDFDLPKSSQTSFFDNESPKHELFNKNTDFSQRKVISIENMSVSSDDKNSSDEDFFGTNSERNNSPSISSPSLDGKQGKLKKINKSRFFLDKIVIPLK